MKVKNGFVLREVVGEIVVLPTGEAAASFNSLITLNETGKFLWEKLAVDVSEDELVSALLQEYEVSEEIARQDVRNFINIMRENDLLA
ncbi:MAG: PqqD family protein [Clostridia bacterium]|nr:PqqD family protein [Clostridia bacterium]